MADKIDAMAEWTKPAPPRFVGERPRTRTIPLEWPIEYDGKLYESVTLRRMTMTEVSDFMRSIEEKGKDAKLPIFDCPSEVIDALDADDAEEINKAVLDFLPRGLRPAEGPHPASGGATSPSSPTG